MRPCSTSRSAALYCTICNPFLYQSYVMTNSAARRHNNLKDTKDLYSDLAGRRAAGGVLREAGRLQ